MPLFTRFLYEQNVVTMTAYDRLKSAEVEQCVEQYASHPFFDASTDVVIDIEESIEAGSEFVRGMAKASRLLERSRQPGTRYFVAGVARNPEHEAILKDLAAQVDTNFEMATFRDLSCALHWLRIKRGAIDRGGEMVA